MWFLSYLEKKNRLFIVALVILLTVIICLLDFITGNELAFSLFYLMPVCLATWMLGRRYGIITSLISATLWILVDLASGSRYSNNLIPFWNAITRFSFFAITTWLLSELQKTLVHEKDLSYTDHLTGAMNTRLFYKLLEQEINRSQRYQTPLSLVYIDLDNFKTVNDEWGHFAGDEVLRTIVASTKNHIRKSDSFARLGGDEFALLLPNTGKDNADCVLNKLQQVLLEEMTQNHWPITFSIGVVTCHPANLNSEDLIRMSDELMYSVKRSGKNSIAHISIPERE